MSVPPATRRHRLLLVDDQPANIHVLAGALSDLYDVCFATSGTKALEIAAQGGIDLVLLDVVMPDLTGFEVCARLKAEPITASIPVIFVTSLGEVEDETRGFALGGVDYLAKPISPPIVRARVRTHLELKDSRDLLEQQARDLERQNELLQENVRLKDHVDRMSRHDLKTPLNSIICTSEDLQEDAGADARTREGLAAIERAAYRVLEMVNRTLDLYQMEQGAYRLSPTAVEMGEVARKVVADLHKVATARDIAVQVADASGRPAEGDELLCYSMLANLVKNAIEASPPGETVMIELGAEDEVSVTIHNAGAVPEALRERFFEKYTTSGKRGGTGLGTYSARLMAETQGGSITLATSEETGTRITVRLPAANGIHADASTGASPQLPPPELWPEMRLMVVDDDDESRAAIRRALSHPAWAIEEAADGPEALEKFTAVAFNCVLMDIEMPSMSGLEAVTHMRAVENRQARERSWIIALSAHDDAKARADAFTAGYDDYLPKPAGRAVLAAAVLHRASRSDRRSASDRRSDIDAARDPAVVALMPQFLSRKTGEVGMMRDALISGDVDLVRRTSHRLKGSFLMYGLLDAADISGVIEQSALSGAADGLSALVGRLETHLHAIATSSASGAEPAPGLLGSSP